MNSISSTQSDVRALSKYERVNGAKTREGLLVLKVEFNFQIYSGRKTLPADQVFSSWVNVMKKAPIINRSTNSNS